MVGCRVGSMVIELMVDVSVVVLLLLLLVQIQQCTRFYYEHVTYYISQSTGAVMGNASNPAI